MAHSTEYQHEVQKTLRLVRWSIYGALALAGLVLFVGIAGFVMATTGGGHLSSGAGTDIHAQLRTGKVGQVTTESGQNVTATIDEVKLGTSPAVVVTINGGEPINTALDRWTLYLNDDTQLPMTGKTLGGDRYSFTAAGELPSGKSARFVHYNPDESHGDLYFDVQ